MRTQLRKIAAVAVLLLTAASVWLPSAHATRVLEKDLRQLTGESALIVIGTVVGVSYEPDPKEDVTFTTVRLERLRAVKGEQHIKRVGNALTLWFQGGLAADGSMEFIAGMPQLRLGETYLLFLRGGEWTMNPIAGWHQGAFRVVSGPGKKSQVVLTLDDAVVMGVHNGQLELHPVRYSQLLAPYQVNQIGEIHLWTKSPSSPAVRQPRDSIYREDNMEELEIQDRARVTQAQQAEHTQQESAPEDARHKTPKREPRMIGLLGREPIELNKFIAAIRQIDRELAGQYRTQPFHAEPNFLPKKGKSLAPPQTRAKKSDLSRRNQGGGETATSPEREEQEETQ